MTNLIALACILTFLSPVALADKPNWAGKGMPNLEEISSVSDLTKAELQLNKRNDDLEEIIETKKNKSKKDIKTKKIRKKLERELEELEVEQNEINDLKDQIKNQKIWI